MRRTHTCGELREDHLDDNVVLQGWVHKRRDHGGVIFIDLRDRYGLTQVVFYPEDKALFSLAERLRREWVIEVHGQVTSRKEGMKNPNLATGDVEVESKQLVILAESDVPPLEIDDRKPATEDIRMKYRYLDMRRHSIQNNFIFRHKAAQAARNFLSSQGHIEIETPLLVKSTPEGARDYVVPSRVNPGMFYSLPQSPQLYKQILMVAGFDKYFQFARCPRDEDLRADRQPEFTQIDIEMSFPEQKDLFALGEGTCKAIARECMDIELKTPFPIITHKEAIDKYGIDKPDIRFELFLHEITDIAEQSNFEVFKSIIKEGGIVKALNVKADFSRKQLDAYIKYTQELGSKGMTWMKVTKDGLESNIAKFFNADQQKEIIKRFKAKPESFIFIVAGPNKLTNDVLARLRLKLGEDLKLFNPKELAFCWIRDFPLYGWNEEEERWEAEHHLFCMPVEEDMKYLESDPGKVRASSFDLVLNGVELASGSIRINRPDIQERVMKIIGITNKEAEEKFGFLLDAFKYGAPPHGGWAIGFDRLIAIMLGVPENDIREVIAFPKNKSAQSPMDGSPSEITKEQLKELHIKLDIVKKKDNKK